MKQKIVLIFIGIFILLAGILVYSRHMIFSEKKIHYHAGFQVYIDGKLQDFSDTKYMDLTPCNEHENNQNNQEEKAHLHENVGDVVHVHRENVVWNDLFKNIGFTIGNSKPIEGYINGRIIQNVLSYPIKPYASLVLLIGSHGAVDNYLSHAVTVQHIKQIEKTSELCGS